MCAFAFSHRALWRLSTAGKATGFSDDAIARSSRRFPMSLRALWSSDAMALGGAHVTPTAEVLWPGVQVRLPCAGDLPQPHMTCRRAVDHVQTDGVRATFLVIISAKRNQIGLTHR